MDSAYISITGPKGANQDSLLKAIEVDDCLMVGVADGVGGHADGKFASETAINALSNAFQHAPRSPLQEMFTSARDAIIEAASQFPLSQSMATTLSVVRICGPDAEVGHVGDTRVYHLRNNGLLSRTIDQTEIAELVRQNVFTPEEALRYPRRNVLLSSLAVGTNFQFYETKFRIEPGDGIIVCSDGLYNAVKKAELIQIFSSSASASEFIEGLSQLISNRRVKDDATLAFLKF